MAVIEKHDELLALPAFSQKFNDRKEAVEEDLEHLESSVKEEARIGHKSVDTSFYGYKERLAMTDERIIAACVVTSGEKSDGPVLEELYHTSKNNGVTIEAIVGDKAYSGKDNSQFTKKEKVHLVAKLHPAVLKGFRKKEDEFFYNKDARLFVCPEGHMAIKKAKTGRTGKNITLRKPTILTLSTVKPALQKWAVIKKGLSLKRYSITLKSDDHLFQKRFDETPYFKEKAKFLFSTWSYK